MTGRTSARLAASVGLLLAASSCHRRADPAALAPVLASVERDARALERGDTSLPTAADWHYFHGVTVRPPVRPLDSRAGFIYDPQAILAELGGGERVVICALGPQSYQVYRLSRFTVPWTRLCPHDLNYVATPPSGGPP